ncbi:MAG: SDR family oxidoreductase [Actinomycetia bacterium]|nr:SDR family oxidoreductase [Actinomycetes bacterium]
MKIAITGHAGYLGPALIHELEAAGHQLTGFDSGFFADCVLGDEQPPVIDEVTIDVRDITAGHLDGFDAVIHYAALSNDPLGDLRPGVTEQINGEGTLTVARAARQAGVPRFVQSSSCSLYGAHGDAPIDESAEFLPVTPYGRSKVDAELGLLELASDSFSPVFLRNATAYGWSPRLRGDLVVNNLTGYAITTGEVFMKSDGTPWRPLVHTADIAQAMRLAVEAPRELVHTEAFNVGASAENYQIRDVARIVEEVVEGSVIALADSAGPDLRNYRVNCDKLADRLGFEAQWTVRAGAEDLAQKFRAIGLTKELLEGSTYQRVARIKELLAAGSLDEDLRFGARAA